MLLENVNCPEDLKQLTLTELNSLAEEIRHYLLETITQTGGHLASNLGAVELTLALHTVFDTPRDKIVWDVGHQSYVHKMLTGRRQQFCTLRQCGGLSGFPCIDESPHDAFGAGHASTSISAALGLAVARDLKGEDSHIIAVIGDGAMTGGLAYEGLNNAGQIGTRLIVLLNDNGMSISANVGAIAKHLNRLRSDPRYSKAKKRFEGLIARLPLGWVALEGARRIKNGLKGLVMPTLLWEQLGFTYLGPIDGHDLHLLQETLQQAKSFDGPTVVHVVTRKGKGYDPAEEDAVSFHGVAPNGSKKSAAPTYTKVFGDTLVRLARDNPHLVAITAAMPDGTGLVPFSREFPSRFFDVGIAEEHAVTFAAGLARRGIKPVVAIYSTFMQRAFDQVIHDVCMQRLPVVFAIDRAGIVGDDGRTHQGAFDMAFMRQVPEMVVMAPKDENELQHMLATAIQHEGPISVRYPRGSGVGVPLDPAPVALPIGRAELLRQGNDITLLAIGTAVYPAMAAAELLAQQGVYAAVVNARFVKPLDEDMINALARRTSRVVTIEEGALPGGFGSAVAELLADSKLSDTALLRLGLPDDFVDHAPPNVVRARFELDPEGIVHSIHQRFPELAYLTAGPSTGLRSS